MDPANVSFLPVSVSLSSATGCGGPKAGAGSFANLTNGFSPGLEALRGMQKAIGR